MNRTAPRTAPAILPPAMPRGTAPRFATPWGERVAQAVDDSSVWAALDAGDVLEAEAEALDALARH